MGDINRIVVFVNLIQALSVRGFKNLRVNLSVLFIDVILGSYMAVAEGFSLNLW